MKSMMQIYTTTNKMKYKKAGDLNTARDHNQMIDDIRFLKSKLEDNLWSHPYSGSNKECALGDILPDPNNTGKKKIRSGYAHGGGSSELLELDNITATIGDKIYIKVNWTANEVDDVLMTGGTMNTAVLDQVATAQIDDVLDKDNLTGHHYRIIGEWVDDGDGNAKWVKDGCGSYDMKMCSNGVTSTFLGVRGDE